MPISKTSDGGRVVYFLFWGTSGQECVKPNIFCEPNIDGGRIIKSYHTCMGSGMGVIKHTSMRWGGGGLGCKICRWKKLKLQKQNLFPWYHLTCHMWSAPLKNINEIFNALYYVKTWSCIVWDLPFFQNYFLSYNHKTEHLYFLAFYLTILTPNKGAIIISREGGGGWRLR